MRWNKSPVSSAPFCTLPMEPKIIGKGSDDPRADLARENALLQQQITTLSAHITDLYRREGQLQERLNRAGMFCGLMADRLRALEEGMTTLMEKTEKRTCAGVNSLPSPAISAAAPDDSDEDKMFAQFTNVDQCGMVDPVSFVDTL
jgi:hypothetical protein